MTRQRLSSWKEIARYLGRNVRTVIRWEKERALPVHRVPGGSVSTVFAYADEIDRWLAGPPSVDLGPAVPQSGIAPRRWGLWAGVIAGLAVISGIVVAAAFWPRPEIASISVHGVSIEAFDAARRTIWAYRLPEESGLVGGRQTQLADLDGTARPGAVVSLDFAASGGELRAFDQTGRQQWRQTIDDQLTFGDRAYAPPWDPDDLLTYGSGEATRIVWAVHHHTWWPGILAVFDRSGTRLGHFVNSGWIRSMVVSADRRYVVVAAFSNSRDGAAFAVLDARQPFGSSPEDPAGPFACRGCPGGRPIKYLVVPWGDIAARSPDERNVTAMTFKTGAIELHAVHRPYGDAVVELSPALEVTSRHVGDGYWVWHSRLEQQGLLTHSRGQCPWRDGPAVREWTPAHGWRDIGEP